MYWPDLQLPPINLWNAPKQETDMTDDIYYDWIQAYVKGDYEDPHQEFADRQGISRIEAKSLCYKVAYTVHLSKPMKAYK